MALLCFLVCVCFLLAVVKSDSLIGQKVVVTVGDSITEGAQCSDGTKYTTYLQRQLGNLKYDVVNAGVSGMTMMKQGQCSPTNTNLCS